MLLTAPEGSAPPMKIPTWIELRSRSPFCITLSPSMHGLSVLLHASEVHCAVVDIPKPGVHAQLRKACGIPPAVVTVKYDGAAPNGPMEPV